MVGVELSQFPSSYIMQELHKTRADMAHTEESIRGHVAVFPFEPHRWAYEVISKKEKKVQTYRDNLDADEVWLVMHGSSSTTDWPMSGSEKRSSRKAEELLLRFGSAAHANSFDRIYFIYCDGEVISLKSGAATAPSRISLPIDAGYPAVTVHHFFLSIDMPEVGQSARKYDFENIVFDETVVTPADDWMAERLPDIDRPHFRATALVTPTSIKLTVFRDLQPIKMETIEIPDQEGKRVNCQFVLTWSIRKTTFSYASDRPADDS